MFTDKVIVFMINICDSAFQANSVKSSNRTSDSRPFWDIWDSDIYRYLVCVPDSSICTISLSTLITTASMDNTAGSLLSSRGSSSRYFGLTLNNPLLFKRYKYWFCWNQSVLFVNIFLTKVLFSSMKAYCCCSFECC